MFAYQARKLAQVYRLGMEQALDNEQEPLLVAVLALDTEQELDSLHAPALDMELVGQLALGTAVALARPLAVAQQLDISPAQRLDTALDGQP